MSTEKAQPAAEQGTGLELVVRSFRALARSTRRLAEEAAEVVEAPVTIVLDISEETRDRVITAPALMKAREAPLPARFRADALRVVGLAADAASLLYVNLIAFLEDFADRKRVPTAPKPAASPSPQTPSG